MEYLALLCALNLVYVSMCTVYSGASNEDRSLQSVGMFGHSETDSLAAVNDHAIKPRRAFHDEMHTSVWFMIP